MTCIEREMAALDGFIDRTSQWVDEYLADNHRKNSAGNPVKNTGATLPAEREA